MKHLNFLYFPIFTILCFSCSGEKEIDEEKLQIRNRIAYESNQPHPFSGKAVKYYDSGQKKYEISYKKGKKHGSSFEWYRNGQKSSEENLKDGKLNGDRITWYKNGQKQDSTTYNNGKQVGSKTFWLINGERFSAIDSDNITNAEDRIILKTCVVKDKISLNQVLVFQVMFCYPFDDFIVRKLDRPKVKNLELVEVNSLKKLASLNAIESYLYHYKPINVEEAFINSIEVRFVNQNTRSINIFHSDDTTVKVVDKKLVTISK